MISLYPRFILCCASFICHKHPLSLTSMASRRNSRGARARREADSRSDCCMSWLVTAMKVLIIILLIGSVIFDIFMLIKHIQGKEEYLSTHSNNQTQYYIDMACMVLAMVR